MDLSCPTDSGCSMPELIGYADAWSPSDRSCRLWHWRCRPGLFRRPTGPTSPTGIEQGVNVSLGTRRFLGTSHDGGSACWTCRRVGFANCSHARFERYPRVRKSSLTRSKTSVIRSYCTAPSALLWPSTNFGLDALPSFFVSAQAE